MNSYIRYAFSGLILCVILVSCEPNTDHLEVPEYIASEEFKTMGLPFSQAVKYGDLLYLSGQVGNIPNSMNLVEGGIGPETRQTMLNIQQVLEANGSSMEQIIKCTCMMADIDNWPEMNKVYEEFFPNNKPARSAFGTNGLALGARVEIECLAYVSK